MDAGALEVLELPAVLERLAAATSTSPGGELARALSPSPNAAEVARRQALTGEAIALLDEAAEPPLRGIGDVRDAAARAARGGVLDAAALAQVAQTIGGALAARAALDAQAELAPLLAELAAPVDPSLRRVSDAIGSAVEEDGSDLRDNASPALRRLRRQLRDGRHRVGEELRRLARGSSLAGHLQEDFVTQRGGRPVLAVKATARGQVRGVVHDASSSGETLFVEPFEVVDLSNALAETIRAERAEVERILRELSALVAARAEELRVLVEAMAEIDVAVACGAVSRGWRGAAVKPS